MPIDNESQGEQIQSPGRNSHTGMMSQSVNISDISKHSFEMLPAKMYATIIVNNAEQANGFGATFK